MIYRQRFSKKALIKHSKYFFLFNILNGYINSSPANILTYHLVEINIYYFVSICYNVWHEERVCMNIDIPYSFINLLAFNTLLKYENKRVISVDTLNKYREVLLEEVKKIYDNETIYGNDTYFLPQDEWKGTISFIEKDENIEMTNFLRRFSELFVLNDNKVYLKNNVDYDTLAAKLEQVRNEDNIGMRFDSPSANVRLRDILEISSIEEQIKRYVKIEEKIESLYKDLKDISMENNKLKSALLIRGLLLNNVMSLSEERISAFKDISGEFVFNDEECNYDQEPLNVDLWDKCGYYDSDDFLGDVESFIYDLYVYAIFGDTTLKYKKLHNDLLKIFYDFDGIVKVADSEEELFDDDFDYIENCYDDIDYDEMYDDADFLDDEDNEDIDFDEESENKFTNIYCDVCEEKFVFYLNYIDKLNKYMEENGYNESLITTRNRLLYAIDEPRFCLYKKENIDSEVEKSRDIEFDEGAFSFIREETRFMTDEVFLEKDEENAVKKLLFISTYYQLTQDKAIKEIMFKHCFDIKFNLYSNLIFGDGKGYSKKMGNK